MLIAAYQRSYFTHYTGESGKQHINVTDSDDVPGQPPTNDFSCKLPTKYILSSLKCNKIGECRFTLNTDVHDRFAVEVVKDNGVSIINRMKVIDDFEPFADFGVPEQEYSM